MSGKRFDVKIAFEVVEKKSSGEVPFFSNILNYIDLPNEALVVMEQKLIATLQEFTTFGQKK